MDKLIPISGVQREDVLNVIRQALRAGLDADALEDFLASVDWSGTDRERPEIADLLGQMEGWGSQYANGDLTRAHYVGKLLSLLPLEERGRRLVLGGGAVVITRSVLHPVARPVSLPGQSSLPPQTGSVAPAELVPEKSESSIVLAV